RAHPTAGQALSPGALPEPSSSSYVGAGTFADAASGEAAAAATAADFHLSAPALPPMSAPLAFTGAIEVRANAAIPVARFDHAQPGPHPAPALVETQRAASPLAHGSCGDESSFAEPVPDGI